MGLSRYVLVGLVPLFPLVLFVGASVDAVDEPCGSPIAAGAGLVGDVELGADQMQVARTAVAAVRSYLPTRDVPRAAVIVLATGFQESRLRNLDYGDRDSLGFLQQRPSQGWGSPAEVRDVTYATHSFLERLVQVPGWRIRRITDVAADVQRPAYEYRGLYEQWVPTAETLVSELWGVSLAPLSVVESDLDSSPAMCMGVMLAGAEAGQDRVRYPVPDVMSGSDRKNWGGRGGRWSSWHTGTDFSVPCGTPVVAATSGTVLVDTTQSWAGPWLVKVTTGPGRLATWYAHMQRIDVQHGQRVESGQQIGDVGARGNATGCHLHFEVHLTGGSIYGPDNMDPSRWLARKGQ